MKRNLNRETANKSALSSSRKTIKITDTATKTDRKTKINNGETQQTLPYSVMGFEGEGEDENTDVSDSDNRASDGAANIAQARPVVKPFRKRIRRRPPEKYAEYAAYRGHITSWAVLSKLEKQQLAMRAIAESSNGSVKCLNERCKRNLKTMEDVVNHVDKCLKLPEYFKYVGKADVFRSLDKATRARILRISMNALEVLPCLNIETLNCTQKYAHLYALSYHLERCGQERDRLPWKCWKCGFITTVAESRLHLATCPNPKTKMRRRRAEDESDYESEGSDSEGLDKSKRNRRSDRQKLPSIAQQYLPEKNSRMRVTDGMKRFKFKNTKSDGTPTLRDMMQYRFAVDRANETLEVWRKKETLCNGLTHFEHCENNFKRVQSSDFSENLIALLEKSSIPVVLPPDDNEEQQSIPMDEGNSQLSKNEVELPKQRLPVFEPKALHRRTRELNFIAVEKDVHEVGCVAYCGGPISTINSCPRRECVAVTVFADEEYLVSRNQNNSEDYIQFWLYENKPERVTASLWFILEVDLSTILCTKWCPALRGTVKGDDKLSNHIGILAVGSMKGPVSLYGNCFCIDSSFWYFDGTTCFIDIDFFSIEAAVTRNPSKLINSRIENLCFRIHSDMAIPAVAEKYPLVYHSKPDLVLTCPECCGNAPVIAMEWSENCGASKFAAISASGHVLIWDLNEMKASARIIHDTSWLSPPLNVAFCGSEQLAVSFREKLIRIYDLATLSSVIEEGAQKSAGMQVYSRDRLFSGIISYQQDFALNGVHLTCGACYVVLGSSENNIFVVPLSNRHEVQLWDLCTCPKTGAIISVGGDGRLQMSLNGRMLAHGSEKDFVFSTCRVVMTVLRKSDSEVVVGSEEQPLDRNASVDDDTDCKSETKLPPPLVDLNLCAEKSHLEFSFEDIKNNKTAMPQFSLDIRTESLNRVSISEASGRLAICGGEAGLLIFMPCSFD